MFTKGENGLLGVGMLVIIQSCALSGLKVSPAESDVREQREEEQAGTLVF